MLKQEKQPQTTSNGLRTGERTHRDVGERAESNTGDGRTGEGR